MQVQLSSSRRFLELHNGSKENSGVVKNIRSIVKSAKHYKFEWDEDIEKIRVYNYKFIR